MKRKRLSRQESREMTRTRLTDAAERLFIRRGFDATSVEQIAGEAGFTRGAFYSNFADKDAIFLEVLEKRLSQTRQVLEFAFVGNPDPQERFRAARDWYAAQVWPQKWAVLRTEFHLRAQRNRGVRKRLSALLDQELKHNTVLLEQYYSEAGLAPPGRPEIIALTLFALATGLGTLSLLGSGAEGGQKAASVRNLAFDRLILAPRPNARSGKQ